MHLHLSAHWNLLEFFGVHVKHQFDNSFVESTKESCITSVSRVHKISTINIAIKNMAKKSTVNKEVIDAVVNLDLEILHDEKMPPRLRACCRRGQLQLQGTI